MFQSRFGFSLVTAHQ